MGAARPPAESVDRSTREQIVNLTRDAILVRDFASDEILFWNPGAESMYGYGAEEVLGRVSHDILHTSHPIELCEAKRLLRKTGRWEGELLHARRDGARIVTASRWTLQQEEGRPDRILEINTDITERKRVEEALQRSEERYRTIVDTANEGIWLVDNQARTVYANQRMAEMLGYTPEELARLTVLECLFPGDEALARERIGQNLQGNFEQFDFRFRHRDGAELLVLACTTPVRDSQGTVVGALGMFTDISERVRAERERIELLECERHARALADQARRRLSTLADASALLASSLDYETTLRSVADAVVPAIADWCVVHIVDPDGSLRTVAAVHADPADGVHVEELARRFALDGEGPASAMSVVRSGRAELLPATPDGTDAAPVPDADTHDLLLRAGVTSWMIVPLEARGNRIGVITLVATESGRRFEREDLALAEVLARRAALAVDNSRLYEEATRVAAEQSATLAQVVDGVVIVDPAGTITFRNEAAKRLALEPRSTSLMEAIEKGRVTNVKGDPLSLEQLPLSRALAERATVQDAMWRLRRDSENDIIVQGSAAPLIGHDGELLGAVATFREVTAQITLEQQKENFLAAAAHDLKTPLTTIKGLAQVLQRRLAQPEASNREQLVDGLARIEQRANRMARMIDDLLDLSRLQMGEILHLDRAPVELVGLVSHCIAEQAELSETRQIELRALVPGVTGRWDAGRLERVFANLLSNATKYSSDDSAITVTIWEEDRQGTTLACVSVQDRGIGIPSEDLPRLFERFHRGRNVGSDTLGSGLGLAGARQIVELHGGMIDVVSEEGAGSTFTVCLPVGGESGDSTGSTSPAANQMNTMEGLAAGPRTG